MTQKDVKDLYLDVARCALDTLRRTPPIVTSDDAGKPLTANERARKFFAGWKYDRFTQRLYSPAGEYVYVDEAAARCRRELDVPLNVASRYARLVRDDSARVFNALTAEKTEATELIGAKICYVLEYIGRRKRSEISRSNFVRRFGKDSLPAVEALCAVGALTEIVRVNADGKNPNTYYSITPDGEQTSAAEEFAERRAAKSIKTRVRDKNSDDGVQKTKGEREMTQKDVNDLCVVVALYTQCHSMSDTMDDLKSDVPDELSDTFCHLSESVRKMLSTIEDYRDNKQHVFVGACSDK